MLHLIISLKVPFNEKDQAKSLGARWNAESKCWYVPQGVDPAPFGKWLTSSPAVNTGPAMYKPILKSSTDKSACNTSFDEDLDAINAKLRDAYEPREDDTF